MSHPLLNKEVIRYQRAKVAVAFSARPRYSLAILRAVERCLSLFDRRSPRVFLYEGKREVQRVNDFIRAKNALLPQLQKESPRYCVGSYSCCVHVCKLVAALYPSQ
jgi:hypothetical protein